MKRNYQKELDGLIDELAAQNQVPALLLHSCCAPCSSYILEYLSQYFKITVLYYNPNIFPAAEYQYRIEEQQRLIEALSSSVKNPVSFLSTDYTPEDFYQQIAGLEGEKEGGKRCERCFYLRLRKAAEVAQKCSMDYFTTTLSISPLKNADLLNQIGADLQKQYGVRYLYSDFKKRNGYKRSIELSAQYGLYRQNYCGCIFSKKEREENLTE